MSRLLRAVSPWSPSESLRMIAVTIGGVVLLAVAWRGAVNESALSDQVPWLSASTMGFGVTAYAFATWLLRGRAAIERRTSELLLALDHGEATVPSAEVVVAGPAPGRFHRPGCALVAGRGWSSTERAAVHERWPCGVCRP